MKVYSPGLGRVKVVEHQKHTENGTELLLVNSRVPNFCSTLILGERQRY